MPPVQVREKLTDGGSPTRRSGEENLIANPALGVRLAAGDQSIAVGTHEDLPQLLARARSICDPQEDVERIVVPRLAAEGIVGARGAVEIRESHALDRDARILRWIEVEFFDEAIGADARPVRLPVSALGA
jgi:hypothetical protein